MFSNEGIGTLVYANEYQAIRPAQKKDVRAVFSLIQQGVETDELVQRTRADLERQIGDYFVFEVDRNPVACAALHVYPEQNKAELASVFVDPRYENQGIGGKLIQYAEDAGPARRGSATLFCLSTQAINYFVQKGGFHLGTPGRPAPAAGASSTSRTAAGRRCWSSRLTSRHNVVRVRLSYRVRDRRPAAAAPGDRRLAF